LSVSRFKSTEFTEDIHQAVGPSKFEASFRCGEPLCFRSWKPCPTINCYPGCVSGSREIWSSATKLGTWKPVPATPAAKRCHSPRQPGWHLSFPSPTAKQHPRWSTPKYVRILWPSNQTPLKQTACREKHGAFRNIQNRTK